MKSCICTASSTLIRRFGLWCAFGLIACLSIPLHVQAQSCTMTGTTATPLPASIKVPSTLSNDQLVLQITVSANYSCTWTAGNALVFAGPVSSGTALVPGSTNLRLGIQYTPSFLDLANASIVTVSSGPCTSSNGGRRSGIKFSSNGTCTGTYRQSISFFADAAGSVSGTIPAALDMPGSDIGWLQIFRCTTIQAGTALCDAFTVSAVAYVASIGSSIPITTIANTCTLQGAANRVVTLPTVPLNAFKGIGSRAGQTLVPLRVNCPVAGAAALNFQLLYVSQELSVGVPTQYLYNSAAAPIASGIAVAITDTAGNIVQTGQTLNITSSVQTGSNGIDLVVSYIQYTSSPTVGNVQGTATFAFTYY